MNRLTRIADDEKPTQGTNERKEETDQDQQNNHEATTTAYRHTRRTICAKPVSTTNLNPDVTITCPECKQEEQGITNNVLTIIIRIVRTMTTLPDDHYAWYFSDPTLTYYTNEEEIGEELNNSENAALNDFIAWYDNHLRGNPSPPPISHAPATGTVLLSSLSRGANQLNPIMKKT